MAKFIEGKDIFAIEGDLYVIPVNVLGVMGAGLAESFKRKYPDLFERYRHDCRMKIIKIGSPAIYIADDGKYYIMFPTKDNYRNPSQPRFIELALEWMTEAVSDVWDEYEIFIHPNWHIVFPPVGCGCGKLDFQTQVKPMLTEWSSTVPNPVTVVVPPWLNR